MFYLMYNRYWQWSESDWEWELLGVSDSEDRLYELLPDPGTDDHEMVMQYAQIGWRIERLDVRRYDDGSVLMLPSVGVI